MATETKNHYIIILCGGTGPRLWPLSRASHPKQFLQILSNDSLLLQTIKRAIKVVPKDHIYLVTNNRYEEKIKAHTSKYINPNNILSEPQKKNTLMAILFATSVIKNKNPDAVITSIPSDQYIQNTQSYTNNIKTSALIASENRLIVVIGYKPDHPNPSFGYILIDKKVDNYYQVSNFVEKPKGKKLENIFGSKSYWNSGIYTYHADTLINEIARINPEYFKLYLKLEENPKNEIVLNKVYSLSPELPIDKVISEKSRQLAMIKADFTWNDIGEWKSIFKHSPKDNNNIAINNKHRSYSTVNSKNCYLSTDNKKKIIGLVGVQDLAIIDTGDALLVCNINDSFYVRDLVGKIVSSKKTEHYFLKSENDK